MQAPLSRVGDGILVAAWIGLIPSLQRNHGGWAGQIGDDDYDEDDNKTRTTYNDHDNNNNNGQAGQMRCDGYLAVILKMILSGMRKQLLQ